MLLKGSESGAACQPSVLNLALSAANHREQLHSNHSNIHNLIREQLFNTGGVGGERKLGEGLEWNFFSPKMERFFY